MPHFKATRHPASSPLPDFDPLVKFDEDVSSLFGDSNPPTSSLETASQRRKWFAEEEHREAVTFTPEHVLQVDFAYGYFQFPDLRLVIPGGIAFDLKKYWNHQPVRFVCCERGPEGTGPGKVFFVVQFEAPELDGEEDNADGDVGEIDVPSKSTSTPNNFASEID